MNAVLAPHTPGSVHPRATKTTRGLKHRTHKETKRDLENVKGDLLLPTATSHKHAVKMEPDPSQGCRGIKWEATSMGCNTGNSS